jgi:hypothetical protein
MEKATKKRRSAAMPVKKTTSYCWVLIATSSGPYRETTDVSVVGVYGTKEIALKQAKIKFEELSHGCYEEGAFLQPDIFEETLDNCATVGDKGVVLLQRDMEGEEEKVEIQKMPLIEE